MSCADAPSKSLFFSRWAYYLSSIPTLLLKIRNPVAVLAAFLGLPVRRPFTIRLANGLRFRVRNALDIWLVKESCLDRDYERGAVSIEDGWTVVDVGAGTGEFAVYVGREHPRAKVFAFEPFSESFQLLGENIRLNGLSNVRALPQAIAGSAGPRMLHTPSGLAGQHRTSPNVVPVAASPTVEATTLDRAFADLSISKCDFLKIDCEGAEYEILFATSDDTLSRVRHIAMEYHDGVTDHSHSDLVRFLEHRGFDVRIRPNPVHREIGLLFASTRASGAQGTM
jgi:FkbM family methyltransferase